MFLRLQMMTSLSLKYLLFSILLLIVTNTVNCQNHFYFGGGIGAVLNKTKVLSNASDVIVNNRFGDNIAGTFHINFGWQRRKNLLELNVGQLQHKYLISTNIIQENIYFYSTRASIRDYNFFWN
jgi:hypothetical protein